MTRIEAGAGCVEVIWIANPFRADKFEAAWRPAAEAVLKFGASGYLFLRAKEDQQRFTQLAFFDSKLDWERYWYSAEIADARAEAAGLFQVPVLPQWHGVVGAGSLTTEVLES